MIHRPLVAALLVCAIASHDVSAQPVPQSGDSYFVDATSDLEARLQ
jgi:hypothetical protein